MRSEHDRPLLLLAGGSGLAPIKSILRTALAGGHRRPMYLYHGVRDARDLYDGDELAQLATFGAVSLNAVLSEPTVCNGSRSGFVHDAVAEDFDALIGFDVYVAGPPPMVDAARNTVCELGVAPEHVYADPFHAAPAEEKRESLGLFKRMGRMFQTRKGTGGS